ncbi:MAG: biotin--[acetyl-CoA-carboxylase] ligase [Oscillospiraceae bacterium]|nr:biotin--[acetyl-CoA-carboxylase] ligase [Oscillospiraceae bacterium]
MTQEKVLEMLKAAGGGYCSGTAISRELGLSRTAVWKAVARLKEEGYVIGSVPNRGYRLERSPDRLSQGELAGALAGCAVGSSLICLDSVDSTNNYAKRLANEGAPHGTVVLAEAQLGGRGRQGNSFSSPAGKGLYLSAILRPELEPAQAVNLTAWIAVAVCDGLERAVGVRPGIKWINDIILNGRKLCGILTEMGLEAESGRLQFVVVGIGVNVSQAEEDFGEDLAPKAVSLAQAGYPLRRAELAAAIIRELDRLAKAFPQEKQSYLERYRRDCLTVGRPVRLLQRGTTQEAFAQGIDDQFGLVVRLPDGTEQTVTSGDVSVRGLEGYI